MTDERVATYEHIHEVQRLIGRAVEMLLKRQTEHDQSKLKPPEAEIFQQYTDRLRGSTYGSEEYKTCLAEMKPALDHHYAANRHHPEFFGAAGIRGMHLIDVLEMLCDWKAATLRHNDGDLRRSIEINQQRFGYSDELKGILLNTAESLGFV